MKKQSNLKVVMGLISLKCMGSISEHFPSTYRSGENIEVESISGLRVGATIIFPLSELSEKQTSLNKRVLSQATKQMDMVSILKSHKEVIMNKHGLSEDEVAYLSDINKMYLVKLTTGHHKIIYVHEIKKAE